MFKARRLAATLSLAALIAASGALPVLADDAVVTGGQLSHATNGALAFSGTLNGADQTLTSSGMTIDVDDVRGTGAGWNVTLATSAFTTPDEKSLDASALKVTAANATSNGEGTYTAPTNGISYGSPIVLGSSATSVFNAATDTGMGKFRITPTFALSLPANAYAGTYSATITVASASGPS